MNRLTPPTIAIAFFLALATSAHHAAVYLAGNEGNDPQALMWAAFWALALETIIGAATLRQKTYRDAGQHIPIELWVLLIGLIIFSMFMNAAFVADHDKQEGLRYLMDVVFGALTLPFAQGLYIHVLAHRPVDVARTPQPASDNLQLQSAIMAAAAPKRKRVAKPKIEQVTAKVAKVKVRGGGKRDGNPHLSGSKEYWAWMRAWQKERANG